MIKRKKLFGGDERRARYAASGVNEKLIMNFLDIHRTMRALYEGRASRPSVLIALGRTGPVAQKALTEHLEIQPATMSDALQGLESAGLIQRLESPSDRRTALIELTEEGQKEARAAYQRRMERHAQMFIDLSPEQKEQLLALLEALNDSWQKQYGDLAGK
ncbi:MAG: MarR family transcriptional regulator [Clostridia bacterium]|nr:MarR family transcriptional regulator [Clostridia bacterium]